VAQVQSRVTREPRDRKRGMTLGEMRAFLAAADAVGVPDAAHLKANIGWRGQLTQLEANHTQGKDGSK